MLILWLLLLLTQVSYLLPESMELWQNNLFACNRVKSPSVQVLNSFYANHGVLRETWLSVRGKIRSLLGLEGSLWASLEWVNQIVS
jgi:hypothetical protein